MFFINTLPPGTMFFHADKLFIRLPGKADECGQVPCAEIPFQTVMLTADKEVDSFGAEVNRYTQD